MLHFPDPASVLRTAVALVGGGSQPPSRLSRARAEIRRGNAGGDGCVEELATRHGRRGPRGGGRGRPVACVQATGGGAPDADGAGFAQEERAESTASCEFNVVQLPYLAEVRSGIDLVDLYPKPSPPSPSPLLPLAPPPRVPADSASSSAAVFTRSSSNGFRPI